MHAIYNGLGLNRVDQFFEQRLGARAYKIAKGAAIVATIGFIANKIVANQVHLWKQPDRQQMPYPSSVQMPCLSSVMCKEQGPLNPVQICNIWRASKGFIDEDLPNAPDDCTDAIETICPRAESLLRMLPSISKTPSEPDCTPLGACYILLGELRKQLKNEYQDLENRLKSLNEHCSTSKQPNSAVAKKLFTSFVTCAQEKDSKVSQLSEKEQQELFLTTLGAMLEEEVSSWIKTPKKIKYLIPLDELRKSLTEYLRLEQAILANAKEALSKGNKIMNDLLDLLDGEHAARANSGKHT